MEKLFVDTNVVLDLLLNRKNFVSEAQHIFTLADTNEVDIVVSALTFANTFHVLSHQAKIKDSKKILRRFKVLVSVVSLSDKIIELALDSDFKDFEDAIQYYSAIEANCNVVITRNKKDFKLSEIPVLTSKEYVKLSKK